MVKHDVIVIGGGIGGLVCAEQLSKQHVNVFLVEKDNRLGGTNQSFSDQDNNIFDYGFHALDSDRNTTVTDYFKNIMGEGNYISQSLTRGIVLQDSIIAYNAKVNHWPEHFKNMFDGLSTVDDINNPLSWSKIDKIYGSKFTSFVKNEILKSYPTLMYQHQQQTDPSLYLPLIYPWFFPFWQKEDQSSYETEYQNFVLDKRNKRGEHRILHPGSKGFGAFMDAIANKALDQGCNINSGVSDIEFNMRANSYHLESISVEGVKHYADSYIWCAPIPHLLYLTGITISETGPLKYLVLGSFSTKDEIDLPYHELLVGSVKHKVNRISFPGRLQENKNNKIQFEFQFPKGELSEDKEFWWGQWENSLNELNIVKKKNTVTSFTFHLLLRGFCIPSSYEKLTEKYNTLFSQVDTNIIAPSFFIGPFNMNRHIPACIECVKELT